MAQVHRLKIDESPAWDAYVLRHPEGSIFHTTRWKVAVEKSFGHRDFYFYASRDGAICGLLPLFHMKSWLFGNVLSSVPFAAYGGILADDEVSFNLLLYHARHLSAALKVDYLELKFAFPKSTRLPESDTYYSFIQPIHAEPELNLNRIPRKQRRMIRVGVKSNLKPIFSGAYLHPFYDILAYNFSRLGTPVFARNWFKTLLAVFEKDVQLLVVEYRGKIVSGVISLFYKDTVLPYYAASLPEYRGLAPNDFQYWELMKYAGSLGYRFFDFGRSKKGTGSFDFKRHWGFEPQPLHYQYYLHRIRTLPELNPLNPKYRRRIEAWKRLPLPLAKMLGPRLVKNIP